MDSDRSIMITNNSISYEDTFRESKKLFYDWRASDALCALFSILGILFATIDYEYTYSNERTHDNCKISIMALDPYKMMIIFTTMVALFYLLFGIYHRLVWEAYMNYIYSGYQNQNISFMKIIDSITWYKLVEIIMLLIIPYPGADFHLYLMMRYQFNMYEICYHYSEIAYLIMLFRVEILLRAISLFSPYEDHLARNYCRKYKVPADARFGIKCLVAQYPLKVVVISAVSAMVLLTTIFRILERPVDDLTTYYYTDYMNALWFLFENMSTLGYGEFLPVTDFGRVVTVIGYFVGTSLFSLMVLTLQDKLELNTQQSKAFTKIYKSSIAAETISEGMRFYLYKRMFGRNSHIAKEQKKRLRTKCKEMKNARFEADELNKGNDEALINIRVSASHIHVKMKKTDRALDSMIAQLRDEIHYLENTKL
ncbi:hypothetical protein SteCoe_20587 [Stentor coeruleus]|uniref:Potassium channel domain-containing protein n=1 Tax=Stentor coeruleus TaxID=5963 RepID=A0A1R2BRW2_9CILI|nr:hypothetical protein SteCoe_20587 [Stentor coeruleus]